MPGWHEETATRAEELMLSVGIAQAKEGWGSRRDGSLSAASQRVVKSDAVGSPRTETLRRHHLEMARIAVMQLEGISRIAEREEQDAC